MSNFNRIMINFDTFFNIFKFSWKLHVSVRISNIFMLKTTLINFLLDLYSPAILLKFNFKFLFTDFFFTYDEFEILETIHVSDEFVV